MSKQSLLNFIEKNISNIKVSKEALEGIVNVFEEIDFEKNEYLLKQGKISDYYYLAEGFARAYAYDTKGVETTTYFYAKDQVIFEAASFFLHVPSDEYIQAITK